MADFETAKVAAYVAAGFCMGIGSIGPALGQGFVGSKACESIGKQPECANLVTKTMVLALAFIESTSIYCLVIALMLIFFVGK